MLLIPKFIRAWDTSATIQFTAVKTNKLRKSGCRIYIRFFYLARSLIDLPFRVFITEDFAKSSNNLKDARSIFDLYPHYLDDQTHDYVFVLLFDCNAFLS